MTIEYIGPAAQRFVTRTQPYDLNHNVAVIVVRPDDERGVPRPEEMKRTIRERIQFAPRLRRRVVFPPHGTGTPFLADDPDFDLDKHIRVIEGEQVSRRRGEQIIGDFLQTPLDRGRALFEVMLIYGGEHGHMVIAAKAHHVILDGVMGWQSIAAVLVDVDPEGTRVDPDVWAPHPLPGRAQAARTGLGHRAESARKQLHGLEESVTHPRDRLHTQLSTLRAIPATVRDELAPSGTTLPINQRTGMHRSVTWARLPMAEIKAIGDALPEHVTVNDIVLGIVATALRAVLLEMGAPEPLPSPRVMIPISVMMRRDDVVTFDQKDTYMIVELNLNETDVVKRVQRIRLQTDTRKGDQASVVGALTDLVLALPAHEREQVWSLLASTREYNLIVSNIHGIDVPLYVEGREVDVLCGIASLPTDHALRIVAMSAGEWLTLGFTVDPDLIPNVGVLEDAALEGLDGLARATGVR